MKLSQLAKETGGILKGDAEVLSLCTDSRVAEQGDLFFCYRGTAVDSHKFAQDAVGRGACLVCEHELDLAAPQLIVPDGRKALSEISAAFYGHPERGLKIVGVTGTNGKTTVTHMLRNILLADGRKTGMIGTLGASYNETQIAPSLTTPDPIALFSLLSDMRRAECDTVVMEVSAHALALKKECPISYEAAIFTNLTQDHLDFFGDMQSYGNAKKQLFSRTKIAVLNADDPFFGELSALGTPVVSYGLDTPADCFVLPEYEGVSGSRALLNLNDEVCEVEIPMAGRHNLYNALAAAATAQHFGVTMDSIVKGLSKTRVDGRLERVARVRGAEIFVDFAHTPDGLEKSLTALRAFTKRKLYVLFGCGGNRDREKRPIMGATASRLADFSYLTSDNPRYEDPLQIISEIEKGYQDSTSYVVIEERERAIAYAISRLEEGDVLLIAGKGGETYREIMGIKYDYNDKAVIKSYLGNLS